MSLLRRYTWRVQFGELLERIKNQLDGLDITVDEEDRYYFYDPDRILPVDGRFPFATVMTTNAYDHASNLSCDGVFRLNIGVSVERYRSFFGEPPKELGGVDGVVTGHDYTAIDQLMPHPVYAAMGWVSILCPSESSWGLVKELLEEAHESARGQYEKRKARQGL